ncbi:MAG: GNAT family N-acetyltransferase [Halobacteria archaeon]|nr:GNAT family N-acetyltransferase [Halobacteria archaeon]
MDADWLQHESAIRDIRHAVFVVEQDIPAQLEWDGLDAGCCHALALLDDGRAVATGRLMPDGRLGRMAVLAEWRGRGIGRAILEHLVARARCRHLNGVYLHAQISSAGFYRKAEFEVRGDPFEEAGIAHVEMARKLA